MFFFFVYSNFAVTAPSFLAVLLVYTCSLWLLMPAKFLERKDRSIHHGADTEEHTILLDVVDTVINCVYWLFVSVALFCTFIDTHNVLYHCILLTRPN